VKKIRILVVSVKSFSDRHEHIRRLSEKFNFDYEFIFKFDPDGLTGFGGRTVCGSLKSSSVSNVLKHLEASRMTAFGNSEMTLVLEDDVELFDDFFERLEDIISQAERLGPGWLIFLGGADNKIDKEIARSSGTSLFERPITTAEAYLIDRTGAILREQWLEKNLIDCQADHQLKKIDASMGIKQYCVSKPLATQGSITGRFKTALDESRARHSKCYLYCKYKWNRLRKQVLPRFMARLAMRTDKKDAGSNG